MVLHEERSSISGSNSRSKSKKNKKTPQRGLGVAQLEKLRMEEQQKNNNNTSSNSSSSNPSFPIIVLPPTTPPKQQVPDQSSTDTTRSPVTLMNKTPFSTGVHHLPIEPPSNQIYRSNYVRPSWPEEERIIGTNPSWPLTMPDFTSFPRRNFPVASPFLKPEESLVMYANEATKFDSRSTAFREDTSSSITHQADWRNSEIHINKRLRENNFPSMGSSLLSLDISLAQSMSRSNPCSYEHPEITNLFQPQFEATSPPFFNFMPIAHNFLPNARLATRDVFNSECDGGVDTTLKL